MQATVQAWAMVYASGVFIFVRHWIPEWSGNRARIIAGDGGTIVYFYLAPVMQK